MPVYVCGRGDDGQLGVQQNKDSPVTVVPGFSDKRISAVATGSGHSLFLTEAGEVYSAGRGDDGRLGHGDALWCHQPKRIHWFQQHGVTVTAIACGSYHSCAISRDGTLYTWGGSLFGKLGHGDENPCNVPKPVAFFHGKQVAQVACGSRHTCVLTSEGELYSFGDGEKGTLGHGRAEAQPGHHVVRPKLIEALQGAGITQLAACGSHTLALSSSGTVYSWGCGQYGRLGHGDEEDCYVPRPINGLHRATDIAAGGFHSAAVTEEGRVVTWGGGCANSYLAADDDQGGEHGQLGNGQSSNTSTPQVLPLPQNVNQIVCGWSHTLMLTDAGDVWATGNGDHHKIPTATSVPLQVGPLRGLPVTAMATYNEHVVFLTAPCGRTGPFNLGRLSSSRSTSQRSDRRLNERRGAVSNLWVKTALQPPQSCGDMCSSATLSFTPMSVDGSGAAGAAPGSGGGGIPVSGHSGRMPYTPSGTPTTRMALHALHGGLSGPTSGFLGDLHSLLNNPDAFPDVTLRVEGQQLYAHRGILAARCPPFAAMLSGCMREASTQIVDLPDASADGVLHFLHFLYTDMLPEDTDTSGLIELWSLADRYLCDRLKMLCERRVRSDLKPDNAAPLLAEASDWRAEAIQEVLLTYMSDPAHFDAVVKAHSFGSLSKELILQLLSRRPAQSGGLGGSTPSTVGQATA